jgi:hypothetical protein
MIDRPMTTAPGANLPDKAYDAAAMGDLRVFLARAAAAGELKTIRGADPHLEIGALFELSHEHLYPPVLLF